MNKKNWSFYLFLFVFPIVSIAQNKVVVVPIGDDLPKVVGSKFRIVPEEDTEGDGRQASDGRLEYRIGNLYDLDKNDYSWGTVCDDNFDDNDNAANAICQDLGYASGVLRGSENISDGEGVPIALDDISCPSGATSFSDCSSNDLFIHNCDHGEDVGVTCSN
ncbi:MAG: scavenger receptor cysteine-rich domain-containing protein [Gammaproteobacteria bacterium]|nr:scavenger receptor cysteine-rich domain-containing protein [Gammaproteobacteria bacterium]